MQKSRRYSQESGREGKYDRDRDRVSLFVVSTCKVSHVRLGECTIRETVA